MNLPIYTLERQLNDFGYDKADVNRILNEEMDKRDEAKYMADNSGYDYEGDDE
jgi:hypothetical protein